MRAGNPAAKDDWAAADDEAAAAAISDKATEMRKNFPSRTHQQARLRCANGE
jgi:hypothetical protein